jgi:Fe-S oxidoreductase
MSTSLVLLLLMLAALAAAGWRARRIVRALVKAPREARWDRPWERLAGVGTNIGLHRRLLQIRYSGVLHLMIFSGFLVLFTAIVQAFGHGLFPGFSLDPIGGRTWIALLQEIFALVITAGLALAAWQRYVLKPKRFAGSKGRDATIIYLLVLAVVLSMLLEFASAIAAGQDDNGWRPVSHALAGLLTALGIGGEGAARAEEVFFWAHICAVLGFLIYIPGSKHRHIFTAAFNIFFRNIGPKGRLPAPMAPEKSAEAPLTLADFSWKQRLDLFSCTECGRCQAACPAYAAGQPLSPKLLIMDLRDHLMSDDPGGPLAGNVIAEDTLWACTTCRACMEVCPLHIEHVPKIVEMRRQLVEEAKVGPTLQDALANLQRGGNSLGKPPRQRARWSKDLGFKLKDARKEPVDVLWFVGDYASFDPRVQRVTLKFARLLQAAGVDFGVLMEAEQNSGNDVRRVGEEGLFEMLARSNIEALAGARFKRIVTTDPHSLNALRQEYPALGGTYEVLHHTDLLLELLQAGRLKLKPGAGQVVTYHDPCYLGRYNGGFEAPRKLIEAAGYRLKEMPRNRADSFCCGAGGGRIWGDDTGVKERPSENRIKEAMALEEAGLFVVACPKDMVMYTAAVQALDVEEKLPVRDVLDLLELDEAAAA